MIQLDASALAKHLVQEPESDALRAHLTARGETGTLFAISTTAAADATTRRRGDPGP